MTSPSLDGGGHASDDALFEAAARWHIQLRDPDAPASLHDAFLAWVRQDPRHLEAYDRAEALWQSMGGTAQPGDCRDEAAIAALIAEGRAPITAARIGGAFCLFLLVCIGLWQGPAAFDSLRADHIAWTGKRESVVLSDGTRIDLNSGTAISVDFTPEMRVVRMFRGEAFFDVAHNSAQPFIVELPEGSVRVIGTSYNIDLTGGSADIALLKGRVKLRTRDDPERVTRLAPGRQVTLRPAAISAPQVFNPESLTAWRNGRMVFYRTPLAEVLTELGRYQRGRIMLVNARAASIPVTGAFSTDDPAEVLDLIADILGLSSHRITDALTVIR